MSIARNFFLGAEPTKRYGPVRLLDTAAMNRIAAEALARIGIRNEQGAGVHRASPGPRPGSDFRHP